MVEVVLEFSELSLQTALNGERCSFALFSTNKKLDKMGHRSNFCDQIENYTHACKKRLPPALQS